MRSGSEQLDIVISQDHFAVDRNGISVHSILSRKLPTVNLQNALATELVNIALCPTQTKHKCAFNEPGMILAQPLSVE